MSFLEASIYFTRRLIGEVYFEALHNLSFEPTDVTQNLVSFEFVESYQSLIDSFVLHNEELLEYKF